MFALCVYTYVLGSHIKSDAGAFGEDKYLFHVNVPFMCQVKLQTVTNTTLLS